MRLTIFARIMIGYLAIFIPVAGVSVFAFSQLAYYRDVTDDILQTDNRMRDIVQRIADAVLAQTRNERKFIITKDMEFMNQFLLSGTDVDARIDEVTSLANNAHKKEMLTRVGNAYERYKAAFNEEVEYVKHNQPYLQEHFKEKKEKLIDEILSDLRNLKIHIEQDTYDKIRHLGESVVKANQIAVAMTAGFILWGVITAVLITRSITRPLASMRKKTRQIATGDFECSLNLYSPPEIGDLAQDFNLMCNKLKATDKMKSDFFALMAHELRTPLASIKEGTNLLLHHGKDDFKEQNEVLRIIAEESNRLTDLVNSLLDLSKMEAGMIALRLENSDIGYLINQAVSGLRPLAMNKSVSITAKVPPDLPYIRMDEERILQALRNLIGNAVKFTPGGGYVTATVESIGGWVKVSVADTGPGVAKEDVNVIFDKFRQGTITDYQTIKGTGLGLAIVKHIIHAHGGTICVQSETGRGSVFTFLLPV